MNLLMKHRQVGPWRAGEVVPVRAVEGGDREADRLVRSGAAEWTDREPTVDEPAAASAVAEMPDDELAAENARLRERLARRRAEADADRQGQDRVLAELRQRHDALAQELAELKDAHAGVAAERDALLAAATDPTRPAAAAAGDEGTGTGPQERPLPELVEGGAVAGTGGARVDGGEAVTVAVPEQPASVPPAAVTVEPAGGRRRHR